MKFFLLLMLLALAGCGSGLCPMKASSVACQQSANGEFLGILDPTFGGTGIVRISTGTGSVAEDMVLQPDGKIVVVGSAAMANGDVLILRLHSNGSLDTTFNNTGFITADIFGADDNAYSVAIQPDGKIVVAGTTFNGGINNSLLMRYHDNGSLDTTFNGTGIVATQILNQSFTYSMTLQPDGKIVVAGRAWTGAAYNFAVARYHTNGSLDTTFNGTGTQTTAFTTLDAVEKIILQPDGKIIALGHSGVGVAEDFALARYHANGSLDTTFNGTGRVNTNIGIMWDEIFSGAIQADGKIIAGGRTNTGTILYTLARYHSNGSLDTNFNTTGIVTTDVLGGINEIHSLLLMPDEKILVGGYSGALDFSLARYNTNGSLDTSLNSTGYIVTDLLGNIDQAYAIARQVDGKILMAGRAHNGTDNHLAVIRYR